MFPFLIPPLRARKADVILLADYFAEKFAGEHLIEDALKSSRGNRSKAARLLSTTERVISYKARKYGIDPAPMRG